MKSQKVKGAVPLEIERDDQKHLGMTQGIYVMAKDIKWHVASPDWLAHYLQMHPFCARRKDAQKHKPIATALSAQCC